MRLIQDRVGFVSLLFKQPEETPRAQTVTAYYLVIQACLPVVISYVPKYFAWTGSPEETRIT
jgi:hypothetical protein